MSILVYNGVQMKLIRTQGISRESIYDTSGVDYLYTRWRFDITAIVNRKATSYAPTASGSSLVSGGGTPVATANPVAGIFSPVLTDAAIRQALATPRRRLEYWVESGNNTALGTGGAAAASGLELLLCSPRVGYYVDAKDGPTPLTYDVKQVVGGKTFLVHWVCETHVNECGLYTGNNLPPIILSNRWTDTHTADEDYFVTRHVAGVAIFRKDFLSKLEIIPDLFRIDLFPLPPLGFKRQNIQVTAHADGCGIDYAFDDVQQPITVVPHESGVTRIQAFHTKKLSVQTDAVDGALEALERAASLSWQMKDSKIKPSDMIKDAVGMVKYIPGVGTIAAKGANWAIDKVSEYVDIDKAVIYAKVADSFARNCLPQYTEVIICRVWGHKGSVKRDLYWLACAVAFGRVQPITLVGLVPPPFSFEMTYDVFGKYVEVKLEYRYAGLASMAGVIGGTTNLATIGVGDEQVVGGKWNLLAGMTLPTQIAGSVMNGLPLSGRLANNQASAALQSSRTIGSDSMLQAAPPPPGDGLSRGAWLGRLVTQGITGPCSAPIPPPSPGIWTLVQINARPTKGPGPTGNPTAPSPGGGTGTGTGSGSGSSGSGSSS